MLGDIIYYEYLLDKNSEGRMLFFPAKLNHLVQPFYNCDKERISISGNIRLDVSENSMKQFWAEKLTYQPHIKKNDFKSWYVMKGKNDKKSS